MTGVRQIIGLIQILVFLFVATDVNANGKKIQKIYNHEMQEVSDFYLKSDMPNMLKSLQNTYQLASEEKDNKKILECVHLLCQVQESLEFVNALEKNAQRLKTLSQNAADVDDVAYYESFAYQFLATCRIYQKDLAGFEAMIDSAYHVLHHCKRPENQLFLKLSIDDNRAFGYCHAKRYQQAYHAYHSIVDYLDEMAKTDSKNLDKEDEKSFRLFAYSSLALIGYRLEKPEEAEEWCNKTLAMYADSLNLINVMPDIVEYLSLSKQDQRLCEVTENFIKTTSTPSDILPCMEFLLKAYERTGQTDKYYSTTRRYIALRDSLEEVRDDAVMVEMSNLFNTIDNHHEFYSKSRKFYYVIFALVVCGLVILTLALLLFYQHKVNKDRIQSFHLLKKLNNQTKVYRQPTITAVDGQQMEGLQQLVFKYMEEENRYLDIDFSITPLATEMKMTPTELETKYQEATGEPFSNLLTRMRLRHACDLLENTDKKLEVIAEESGFGSSRTFFRQFKSEYNMTPNVYRQLSKTE